MVERERLLAALRAKLDRAVAMQDRSLLLGPDTFDEARQLAAMLRDDDDDLQVRLMLGWLHVDRFVALPDGEERPDVEAAIAMFTPCFIAEVADLPEEMLPLLAEEAVPTAIALLREALVILMMTARFPGWLVSGSETSVPFPLTILTIPIGDCIWRTFLVRCISGSAVPGPWPTSTRQSRWGRLH